MEKVALKEINRILRVSYTTNSMLTAKQILDQGIVIPSPYSKPAQVGIDLSLASVHRCLGGSVVFKDRTFIDPKFFEEAETTQVDHKECWVLKPGTYAITFNEGCKIPANAAAFIIHRSSLYRTGTSITSPVWDPGFETEKMGTVMIVNVKLIVERNARVAQMIVHETQEDANLYQGQWQGGTHSWEKAK
jgi:deoxycytidine triphosphate deaminase